MNSIGSVIPVKNETIAEPANNAATLFFCTSPFALNHIAAAIAGNPNIITGKNPAWNVPAVLPIASPLRNMNISPLITEPSALTCSPPRAENQNNVFGTWCNPNGINNLFIRP